MAPERPLPCRAGREYDSTGRLFLASEDPVPVDQNLTVQQQQTDMKYGVVTINEVRSERGLPPVPWGDVPWLPQNWDWTDAPRVAGEPGSRGRGGTGDRSSICVAAAPTRTHRQHTLFVRVQHF